MALSPKSHSSPCFWTALWSLDYDARYVLCCADAGRSGNQDGCAPIAVQVLHLTRFSVDHPMLCDDDLLDLQYM